MVIATFLTTLLFHLNFGSACCSDYAGSDCPHRPVTMTAMRQKAAMFGLLHCVENGRFENPYASSHYVDDLYDHLASAPMSHLSTSPHCDHHPYASPSFLAANLISLDIVNWQGFFRCEWAKN
jgi:hypothetical protein